MRKYLKDNQYSYKEEQFLGKGSFGKVYKGYDHFHNKWVAIKSINLSLIQNHTEQMKEIICNQISVMRKFTIKHYQCFRTQSNIYIVMELCQGGSLHDVMKKDTINEKKVIQIISNILEGLIYLQNLNICHRDLKPQNIFVSHQFINGQDSIIYKIGDFGFAAQKSQFNEILGTYPYMAPQIYNKQIYSSKVDVWALGVITYQLLFQQIYFIGKNKWQIQNNIKNKQFLIPQKYQNKISKQMKEFLFKCLQKDKTLRPKASQLVKINLFIEKNKYQYSFIFEAIQKQLILCSVLRNIAQQLSQFSIANNYKTQFMQMYLLKRAQSIINYLSYSIKNKQNYLGIQQKVFMWLLQIQNNAKYCQLYENIQKQYIITSSLLNAKYKQFIQYIQKFSEQEITNIKKVINIQNIYQDINTIIFKNQIQKCIRILKQYPLYSDLQLKCSKISQI